MYATVSLQDGDYVTQMASYIDYVNGNGTGWYDSFLLFMNFWPPTSFSFCTNIL